MKFNLDRFPIQRASRADVNTAGRSLRIRCACGATSDFAITGSRQPPPEQAAKRFERQGWHVGRDASEDQCPKCVEEKQAAQRAAKLQKKECQMAEQPKIAVTLPVAEPPRTMDRAARRMVFDQIELVYPVIEKGYTNGQTDEAIAKRVGVPRAWVTQVREENFGPEFVIDWGKIDAERDIIVTMVKVAGEKIEQAMDIFSKVSDNTRALEARIERLKTKTGK